VPKLETAIIDYGVGNVFSVVNAIERVGGRANLTSSPHEIMAADRVILPGVGAFGHAIEQLRIRNLECVIRDFIETEKPFLGICVGMQMLMDGSEEFGYHRGLEIIPGVVRKISSSFAGDKYVRIPLIGWASVDEPYDSAWDGTPFSTESNSFYFVHSFHAELNAPESCVAVRRLGQTNITAAVRKNNVLGVQFHPERSSVSGLKFLSNFLNL
jgi:glutamine amidotransferase